MQIRFLAFTLPHMCFSLPDHKYDLNPFLFSCHTCKSVPILSVFSSPEGGDDAPEAVC